MENYTQFKKHGVRSIRVYFKAHTDRGATLLRNVVEKVKSNSQLFMVLQCTNYSLDNQLNCPPHKLNSLTMLQARDEMIKMLSIFIMAKNVDHYSHNTNQSIDPQQPLKAPTTLVMLQACDGLGMSTMNNPLKYAQRSHLK